VFSVETDAGVLVPALILENGDVMAVEVDMGEPILDAKKIPTKGFSKSKVINEEISLSNGQKFSITSVSMGNPHAVTFLEDIKGLDLEEIGPLFEKNDYFPNGINTEFVQIVDRKDMMMRVWERGAGETLACGTGACAAVVAGVLNDKCDRSVQVRLAGGELKIEWQESDNRVTMTGPAVTVFRGEIEI